MFLSDELPFICGFGSRAGACGSDGNAEEESLGAGFCETLTFARVAAVFGAGGGAVDADDDEAHGGVR